MDDALLAGLPGEALVRAGVTDLAAGRGTIEGYLVLIAARRLRDAGIRVPATPASGVEPERQLYRLLRNGDGDSYSRYTALKRELSSFAAALERRVRTAGKVASGVD